MLWSKRGAGLVFLVLGLAAPATQARDLYDDATLTSWQPRYARSTTQIFNEAILPAMTPVERQRLGTVPPLDFPLRPTGDGFDGYPLAFYVPAHRRAITAPVSSLKFLDDICTSYAWLYLNDYGIETVSEYSAILRFAEKSPQGGFPPPLHALQIPANALEDKRVDNLALNYFASARAFLLAHELGHILFEHKATSYEQSRKNEQEADRFAYTLLARTSLTPIGALFFFMADAHWSHIEKNPNAKHPLSGTRLRAGANWMEDVTLAKQFEKLGDLLDDAEIRHGFLATGKAGDLAALAPRRPGELPRRVSVGQSGEERTDIPFHGRYRGYMTQADDEGIVVEVVFERSGNQVRGSYNFGLGFGRIVKGVVLGNRLEFGWEFADGYGRGILYAPDARSFRGTWGYREAAEGAGIWEGQR